MERQMTLTFTSSPNPNSQIGPSYLARSMTVQSPDYRFSASQPKPAFGKITQSYNPDLPMSLPSNFSSNDLSIDIRISDSFGSDDDDA